MNCIALLMLFKTKELSPNIVLLINDELVVSAH